MNLNYPKEDHRRADHRLLKRNGKIFKSRQDRKRYAECCTSESTRKSWWRIYNKRKRRQNKSYRQQFKLTLSKPDRVYTFEKY
jgi:hypothetical protein